MVETDVDKGLRPLDNEFYVWFTIRAERNPENENIHAAFKAFCKEETKNDYTLGLKRLLEMAGTDFKYELLYGEILKLNKEIQELKNSSKKDTGDKDDGTF
jgi:hypothetical protein